MFNVQSHGLALQLYRMKATYPITNMTMKQISTIFHLIGSAVMTSWLSDKDDIQACYVLWQND